MVQIWTVADDHMAESSPYHFFAPIRPCPRSRSGSADPHLLEPDDIMSLLTAIRPLRPDMNLITAN